MTSYECFDCVEFDWFSWTHSSSWFYSGAAWEAMLAELDLEEHAESLRPLQMLLAVHDGQTTPLDQATDRNERPANNLTGKS